MDDFEHRVHVDSGRVRYPGQEAIARLRAEVESLKAEDVRLRNACSKENDDICQTLGSALGYPKFVDDPAIFPGATEADGVCIGDHVAASLACEAADMIAKLQGEVEALKLQGAAAELVHRETATTVLVQMAEVEALRADAQAVAALLPGPYYMDPPDGGSVTVIEQLRRMAADAARYRWLRHHSTYTTVTPCIHGEVAGPSRMRWYHDSYQLQAFTLDAAIDAARAAQGDN